MAQNETWLNHDMMNPVKVKYLDGNLFSMDNAGNLIGVTLTKAGEAYSGGGTVSANVIRSDGGTVAVSGELSDNNASVILPQAAYAVPGLVSIIVKLTNNSEVTTIAALVANVYQSSTDTAVDPGTVIPSIQTLINEIEAAVNTIPPDYSALVSSVKLADEYARKVYVVTSVNLFDYSDCELGDYNSSGVPSTSTTVMRTKTPVQITGTHTISNYKCRRFFYDASMNFIERSDSANDWDTPDGAAYVLFSIAKTVYDAHTDIMVNVGTTQLAYQAFSLEAIITDEAKEYVVGETADGLEALGTEFHSLSPYETSVNLFDYSDCELGDFNSSGQETESDSVMRTKTPIRVDGDYIVSNYNARKVFYDESGTFIERSASTSDPVAVPSGAKYVRFAISKSVYDGHTDIMANTGELLKQYCDFSLYRVIDSESLANSMYDTLPGAIYKSELYKVFKRVGVCGDSLSVGYSGYSRHYHPEALVAVEVSTDVWQLPSGTNAQIGDYIRAFDGYKLGQATAAITGGSTNIVKNTNWTETPYFERNLPYSWVKCIGRDADAYWLNFGEHGFNVLTWCSSATRGKVQMEAENNKCQMYIICLGVNDSGDTNRHVDLGTPENIVDDPDTVATTYYGGFARIIQLIKRRNPFARVFCSTIPDEQRSVANRTKFKPYNDAVRYIAGTYYTPDDNVFLLDIAADYGDYFNAKGSPLYIEQVGDDRVSHFSSVGYQMISKIYEDAISKVMLKYQPKFMDTMYIPCDTAEPTPDTMTGYEES